MYIKTKAATFWQLTFSVIILSTFFACQDPGTIGGGFVEKSEIDIDTLSLDNITLLTPDAYLGKLGRSAIGNFEDELFGNIEAYSFFKPSIQRSSDTLVYNSNTRFLLRFQLANEFYGDSSQTNSYTIHRVTTPWRGASFRNSMDVSYDEGEIIGQFNDAQVDTNGIIDIELTGSWKEDYINFFNLPDSTRDGSYFEGDNGLVIVSSSPNKVSFTSFNLNRLISVRNDSVFHPIQDWAYDYTRTNIPDNQQRLVLSSAYSPSLSIDLSEIGEQVRDINFVRAELIFKVDTLALSNTLQQNEFRPGTLGLSLLNGPSDDIAYDMGFGTIDLGAGFDKGFYRFNITGLLNSYIHNGSDLTESYIFLSTSSGVISFTSIFDSSTGSDNAPKVIIYGLD